MANLDTRKKRASSVRLGLAWLLAPPLPDGTLDAGDRQHQAWSYSGILAGVAAMIRQQVGKLYLGLRIGV